LGTTGWEPAAVTSREPPRSWPEPLAAQKSGEMTAEQVGASATEWLLRSGYSTVQSETPAIAGHSLGNAPERRHSTPALHNKGYRRHFSVIHCHTTVIHTHSGVTSTHKLCNMASQPRLAGAGWHHITWVGTRLQRMTRGVPKLPMPNGR